MDKYYQQILDSIPESIDFNFITVKNESVRSLFLDNQSNMSILFTIENGEGYTFEPSSGVVQRHRKQEIKIKITPESAIVLVANAKITLDDKVSKIMKISSISKYPYLTINKSSLDFGVIQIGKYTIQELVINNTESVPARFTISKHSEQPGKHPEVFYLSATKGEIPPYSAFLLKIKYVTFFPAINSFETYTLKTIGGNVLRFSCSGSCLSLSTYLNAKCVNFKSVPLGGQMTKLIRVYNDSDQETDYQIFHNNDGAFKINKTEGTIKAHTNMRINITFRPYETITYYERVFCLIKNHMLISLDLYGSCHDLLNKSPLIEQKFIDIFRYKILNGLYFNKSIGTENENEYLEKITRSLVTKTGSNVSDLSLESTNQIQLHKELFWETTSNTRIISFDTEHIDFRFVEHGKTSEPYILRVKNNTNEKVKVKWILEKPINTSNLVTNTNLFNFEECVFIIQPEESVIGKQGTNEFKVYFKPNKSEYYFYSDITCQASMIAGFDKKIKELNEQQKMKMTMNNKKFLKPIQSKTMSSFGYKTKLSSTLSKNQSEYFDPPVSSKLSVVGHSFPPGNQIFIPIYELNPAKEIFFPPSTLKQSLYQTLKITNKSDTPLFYKIAADPTNVFRVHRKYGLIPAKDFHLICIEFSPTDACVYRYPLRIVLNHDSLNMKTIILNGLSVDPVLEIEGVKNEIYFPPSFVGIKTKKKISLINRSPIRVNVNIKVEQSQNGVIEVHPNSFEMDTNLIKEIEVTFCPIKTEEVNSKLIFIVERIYDSTSENIGIYNPGSVCLKNGQPIKTVNMVEDKRPYVKEVTVLGRGSDGNLTLSPTQLEFGTVKVGFHKKLSFSIYNPTITNFYIKIIVDTIEDEKKQKDSIQFDFTEGLINSFCKKEVNVTFRPVTRSAVNLHVMVYATENKGDKETQDLLTQTDFTPEHSLKCELVIKANGDYPLIKIADIRNDSVGTCALWHSFNVDEANAELQKQLTDEEINYMSNDKTNKKIQEFTDKLKCIKFDFGKQIKKKTAKDNSFDVYLTLKNEGGVSSEFFFKFPDDISIKREIWMDPVEPTSNDKVEYHVLKEKIFEIEPRKSKLEPNECCNIRLRYNKKEKGDHRLRVIFQIVNGKPLIFELFAQCYSEKQGILEIKRPVLDFSYVPIGYMTYLVSPIELSNVGGIKIKYKIEEKEINKFNEENDHFEIFKMESMEGTIGPGDLKYLPVFFRPLTSKEYVMNLLVHFTDEMTGESSIPITIKGKGYHPLQFVPPPEVSPFATMPQDRMCKVFGDEFIQKCAVSVEEIDFGSLQDKTKNKTFILYNFSKTASLNFDFREPGFLLKDEIEIKPNKDKLEPNSHTLIKMALTPKGYISNYEGEIEINITWNAENSNKVLDKEKLHIRIRKKSKIKEVPGLIEKTQNESQCFVETMLTDLTREILSEQSFEKMLSEELDNQPLGLFDWTSDIPYPTQEEVRGLIMTNYGKQATSIVTNELNNTTSSIKRAGPNKNTSHMSNTSHKNAMNEPDLYGEEEDLKIQDKYMTELLDKYKLTIPEVNESLAVVNEESRKLLSNDIMETTIYNIISEAVYGETDLTEKTRIYFFNK